MKPALFALVCLSVPLAFSGCRKDTGLSMDAPHLASAPLVPQPIAYREPRVVPVYLEAKEVVGRLMAGLTKDTSYTFWTFNGTVPGPFIRMRVGDTMEVHLKNASDSTMAHNVDFHAVTGPGGGAAITMTQPGQQTTARFKLLHPGLFVYHCATPPVTEHIANGMYGLILVEPEKGLPRVDREYYVMQSEFYTKGKFGAEGLQAFDVDKATDEKPTYVVFNGRVAALQEGGTLQARTGETLRIFFGNAGPNLVSSWHTIGVVMDRVYREGSVSRYDDNIQTTLVPAGGSAIAEFKVPVPGNFTIVDHSIFRMEKGAMGILHVEGPERKDIYEQVK